MSDFETIINTRRSIREYQDKEVEDEKILKILKAGMQAPGSRLGAEPWEFVIVKDKDTLAKLGEIKPRVTNAPVAIVLVANIERAFYKTVWQQDMGAAAENMLLEAVNLGLGGLWNGVAPEEERMAKIGEIIGGSQREEDYEKLRTRAAEMGVPDKDIWWYLDTRRFGTAPHSGFGLGFERLLLFVTGMQNIRDVIPFPRTPNNCEF